jgi:putative ABC transport system ATP-binding protein
MNESPTQSQTAGPLLEARDVRKTYIIGKRSLEVLKGVTVAIQAGEFLAIRGASGAGKSTLLHLLGGLDLPNTGTVWLGGRDLRSLSTADLAAVRNTRVGLIFQAYHLLPELNALENVCLPARISYRSTAATEQRALELLARVGLGERTEHRPYELSGGEQQRVAIARALINDPDLILADEPTGNLDSRTGEEIMELLCSLRTERNATLIIATHDTRVATRAARTIEIVDGQIKANGVV